MLSPGAVELNQETDSALVPSEVRNITEVEAADWWALLLLEELLELKNSMRRSCCPTDQDESSQQRSSLDVVWSRNATITNVPSQFYM